MCLIVSECGSAEDFDVGTGPGPKLEVFRGVWSFGLESRTTEVMAVSDFDANIQRFSENANMLHRNFTVVLVKTRVSSNLLNPINAPQQ